MFGGLSHLKVYLAPGYTDMRKAINGLSILVDHLDLDPFSGHLFVFCNRRQTMLKILYWEVNGFCLWQKRLEKNRFTWPKSISQAKPTMEAFGDWLRETYPPDTTQRIAWESNQIYLESVESANCLLGKRYPQAGQQPG